MYIGGKYLICAAALVLLVLATVAPQATFACQYAFGAACPIRGRLPRKMMAVVAVSSQNYSLQSVSPPTLGDLRKKFALKGCEVLLKVLSSSVNPADRVVSGPFPQVMGSDLVADVVEVEPDCQRLRVGDRVWADIGAVVGEGKENGAYGQFASAMETQLWLAPAVSVEEAASLPKVSLTSYKALKWYGGAPYHGETVLILGGSGGCGTTGIQLAKAWGAGKIIATTSKQNAMYVRQLGADAAIDYHAQQWWEVLPDGSIDVIYDTVGEEGTGDRAMPKLRPGGHYVTITGSLPKRARSDVTASMFINSKTNLENFWILDDLRALVDENMLRMPRRQVLPLQDIFKAFNESASRHVLGKLVISVALPSQDGIAEAVY